MKKKPNIFAVIIIFIGIPAGINFLIAFLTNGIILYLYTPEEIKFFDSIIPSIINIIGYSLSFIVPIILVSIYSSPAFDFKKESFNKVLIQRRITMAPMLVPFLSMSGWAVIIITHFITVALFSQDFLSQGTLIIMKYLLHPFLNGFFGFIFCFYSMELLIRKYLIPCFFSGDEILSVDVKHYLKIRTRMMFLYYGTGLFPLILMSSLLIKAISHQDLPHFFILMIVLYIVCIPLSLLLLFMNSQYLQKPLDALKGAIEGIAVGNYNVALEITSRDEIGYLTRAVNNLGSTIKEREQMNETLGRVVDPAVRDHLLNGNHELGGEYLMATILFSDIRDFTTLSEWMRPDEVVALLNRYFSVVNRCISENRGIVNKYIGDAVMALFGVPDTTETHATDAVQAAIAMREARDNLNKELKEEGLPELKTGIGIHSGMIVAGNIGSNERMEYTVIGDTVNLASRLEGACKKTGKDLLISEETFRLSGMENFHSIGNIQVKGRVQKARIYCLK